MPVKIRLSTIESGAGADRPAEPWKIGAGPEIELELLAGKIHVSRARAAAHGELFG